jgi:hypothetical protein
LESFKEKFIEIVNNETKNEEDEYFYEKNSLIGENN